MTARENSADSSLDRFATEAKAYEYLEATLWPNGAVCPHCNEQRARKLNRPSARIIPYKCGGCGRTFSVTFGTILHGSRVPLNKWLQAAYLTDGGSLRIRARHLERILAVSSKTARRIQRKLAEGAASDGRLEAIGGRTRRPAATTTPSEP